MTSVELDNLARIGGLREAAARLPDEPSHNTAEDDTDLGDDAEAADEDAAA